MTMNLIQQTRVNDLLDYLFLENIEQGCLILLNDSAMQPAVDYINSRLVSQSIEATYKGEGIWEVYAEKKPLYLVFQKDFIPTLQGNGMVFSLGYVEKDSE